MLGVPVGVEHDAPRSPDTEFDGSDDHHGNLPECPRGGTVAGIQKVSNRSKDLSLDLGRGFGLRGRPYRGLIDAPLRMRRLFELPVKRRPPVKVSLKNPVYRY